ncbi:MAG: hypothetical protein EA358_06415 [Flavobacteriales bacterium]|nr:MAG: hypothetical protein EA358_06415 [Flavobacteriales bacterium]
MCTLTYLPRANGFVLTSSRDELPKRVATPPSDYEYEGKKLVFPKDKFSQGSWLVSNDRGRVSSLLNGGLQPHQRRDSYRKSRGIVHLDLYLFSGLEEFSRDYNLNDIEPFTIVSVEGSQIIQLVWTGSEKLLDQFDGRKPKIWSSSMLYDSEMKKMREIWFAEWLNSNTELGRERMMDFHQQSFTDDPRCDVIMQRETGVRTTSITQIISSGEGIEYFHYQVDEDRVVRRVR